MVDDAIEIYNKGLLIKPNDAVIYAKRSIIFALTIENAIE